jgi:hypothetical protein
MRVPKYLIDFALAMTCRTLRLIAKAGIRLFDADLLHSQWRWIVRLTGALSLITSSRLMSFLLALPDDAEIVIGSSV